MKRDPIVEEVHRIREKMWDECGGDLNRLIESLRASEARRRETIISKDVLAQHRRGGKSTINIHGSGGKT